MILRLYKTWIGADSLLWVTAASLAALLLASGCVMRGTTLIHSPTAEGGIPSKPWGVNFSATKHAPPDAITLPVNDSMRIIVRAKPIWDRRQFGGILVPIFPLFWLPKSDWYEEYPNSLILQLWVQQGKADLRISSATVLADGQLYPLQEIREISGLNDLHFALPAEQTPGFELINLSVYLNDEPVTLPTIHFQQVKQRWRFIGP